ncbi:ricin-type beta-trefoil lectin domain protein [Streptomyces sp. Li-HN-5-11]|uniref:RICIN domain-containing protein n=1 Tax=Streptomyces sp. Li-HN-5-11 TaxID=3075432 RepID=UPI0028AC21F5|nr:ricin-type beta-trefoil lectin domain protein [Streptomyces sp. Li-HN-5-11]WNM33813.1 ricin-type beta-trefoil lectin domain protein [Streptomyces sp. Li-HN-5-11]
MLRHRKALALGVALTSLALLVTVLAVKGWTNDASDPARHATWGAPSSASVRPGAPGDVPSGTAGAASAASAVRPAEVARGRLRSLTAGLCLGVRGGRVTAGATAELVACSAAASQQWSYQEDGLLRSAADPAFCLDSDPARRTVLVSGCAVHAGEVTYDLTVRGELLLRRGGELVVAPGAGASRATVVVEARDGSEAQRWLLDPGPEEAGESGAPRRAPAGTEPGRPERHTPPRDTPPSQDTGAPGRDTGAPAREPAAPSQPEYQVRLAPAGCCGDAGPDGARSRDSGPQVAVSTGLWLAGAGAETVAAPVHAVDSAVSHVVGAVPEPVSALGR